MMNYLSSQNNIVSWDWDFGNGNVGVGPNPSIILTQAGQPDITLIVTSGSGCKDTIVKNPILVEGPKAIMTFTQIIFERF